MTRLRSVLVAAAVATAGVLALAPAASAHPTPSSTHRLERAWARPGHSSLGSTTVTTAPGVATTLLKAGVLPLPVFPRTGFSISYDKGLVASYRFPITSSTANLAAGTGDIVHSGGILFAGRRGSLEVGRFDIDLAAGKVYATEVNFRRGRVALLDLDLSGLKVSTGPEGSTVLSGISAALDGEAATALNSTFGTALPTDGSLTFGSAVVVLT